MTSPRRSIADLLKTEMAELMAGAVRYVPGHLGRVVRYSYYKKRLKSLGRGAIIDEGVHIIGPAFVSIGAGTWIDKGVILLAGPPDLSRRRFVEKPNGSFPGLRGELRIGTGCHIAPLTLIQAHGGVSIGDYVGIASGSKIYSLSHHYRNLAEPSSTLYKFSPRAPEEEQFLIVGPVTMGDNSALGLNSVVLPGVSIGRNSWVGTSSTVSLDIPPDCIAGGSPAKLLKKRSGSGGS